jgi:ABC-type branched-subunit amino acid transport system ATPase component
MEDSHIEPQGQRIFWTQDLSIAFGGLMALDGVSLHVHRGEILGLIGPNGSGKTTIFNIITGIYTPTRGDFFFEGQPLRGRSPHEIARCGIARTFQISRLCLNLSLLDNVFIGMHQRQKRGLADAVIRRRLLRQEVKAARDKAFSLLDTFNPELVSKAGKPAGALPQIDRRRVEICRALAMEPKLLLLDEPSAGMNPGETAELMEDIRKVQRASVGISVVIIEHDMQVIQAITERVAALNHGRKIAEGTFEEVARNREVREAYLGKRAGKL